MATGGEGQKEGVMILMKKGRVLLRKGNIDAK